MTPTNPHTHTQSLTLSAPPPHIQSQCLSKRRRRRTPTRHRPVAEVKTPAPDRAMAASHARACSPLRTCAQCRSRYTFVYQIQHGVVLQIEAGAVVSGLRRRGWKELENCLNFFETKSTSLSLSASCAPEFSEASAHPVGLNPGMVIDALGPVRRGLGPGGPESTPRPSLTLRASPNTVQTRSATQLPAIRAHKDMLEVARSAQRYLNVTYPWSRRSLDA